MTQETLINRAKRLVAAEQRADEAIERHTGLIQQAQAERTAKAFEVGQVFVQLRTSDNGTKGMTQRAIATECGVRESYVSERLALVGHYGEDFVTKREEKGHATPHLTALISKLPPKRLKIVKVKDEAAEPEDDEEEVTEEEADEIEAEAIAKATDAQERERAESVKKTRNEFANALEAVQRIRVRLDDMDEDLRPLLREFYDDIKPRCDNEWARIDAIIDLADATGGTVGEGAAQN